MLRCCGAMVLGAVVLWCCGAVVLRAACCWRGLQRRARGRRSPPRPTPPPSPPPRSSTASPCWRTQPRSLTTARWVQAPGASVRTVCALVPPPCFVRVRLLVSAPPQSPRCWVWRVGHVTMLARRPCAPSGLLLRRLAARASARPWWRVRCSVPMLAPPRCPTPTTVLPA